MAAFTITKYQEMARQKKNKLCPVDSVHVLGQEHDMILIMTNRICGACRPPDDAGRLAEQTNRQTDHLEIHFAAPINPRPRPVLPVATPTPRAREIPVPPQSFRASGNCRAFSACSGTIASRAMPRRCIFPYQRRTHRLGYAAPGSKSRPRPPAPPFGQARRNRIASAVRGGIEIPAQAI